MHNLKPASIPFYPATLGQPAMTDTTDDGWRELLGDDLVLESTPDELETMLLDDIRQAMTLLPDRSMTVNNLWSLLQSPKAIERVRATCARLLCDGVLLQDTAGKLSLAPGL